MSLEEREKYLKKPKVKLLNRKKFLKDKLEENEHKKNICNVEEANEG